MSNPSLNVGDVVDVFIKGARIIDADSPLAKKHGHAVMVAIPGRDGQEAEGAVWTELDAITITVVEPATPAEWPPRPGDLWRDRDQELWFGTTAHHYRHGPDDMPAAAVVELVHAGGRQGEPDEVNRECGPLQLVRREEDGRAPDAAGSWPPQVGDVWRDSDEDLWIAIDTPDGLWMKMLGDGRIRTPQYVEDNYGPLTFVRRQAPEAAK